ncbi:MAG TPA: hypothetical protein VI585_17370 [Candidatus Binatia bacterium]
MANEFVVSPGQKFRGAALFFVPWFQLFISCGISPMGEYSDHYFISIATRSDIDKNRQFFLELNGPDTAGPYSEKPKLIGLWTCSRVPCIKRLATRVQRQTSKQEKRGI